MFHPDLSPPASNEEAVNSPKSGPLSGSRPSPYSSSSNPSPQDQDLFYKTTNKSPSKIQKIMSSDSDAPCSPHSSTSSLKSPDCKFYINPSPESTFSNTITTNVTSTSRSLSTNTVLLEQCKICGDKAEKEHFNALVCDSCRGFFKRAIKNSRKYTCIDTKSCVLTKKTRNHCQYCRLARCHKVGMNKEAVESEVNQEKKAKELKKKNVSSEVSSSDVQTNMVDLDLISSAELFVDPKITTFANVSVDPIRQLCLAADKQLASLAEWAKKLPHFTELPVMDQVKLLQWNWPELLIGGFCYRSSAVSEGILLSTGLHLSRENLQKAGVGALVNKLFSEVINKIRKLQIDVSEWGCLRAIMLFAPDTKELNTVEQVEDIRERYIATLCDYVKKTYPEDPNRIGNLLLRLPPLKAIALQVLEHLFFFKLIGDVPIDTFLLEMLDVDSH